MLDHKLSTPEELCRRKGYVCGVINGNPNVSAAFGASVRKPRLGEEEREPPGCL